MSDARDQEFRDRMSELMDSALSDDVRARLKKKADVIAEEFSSHVEYWITDHLGYYLAQYIHDHADRAIESMLAGNEEMFRRYLKCQDGGWNGRDSEHSVIHGRLFEADCIEVRRKLCEAFPDLLKTERILDLEDQVRSLVVQNNKQSAELEAMLRRDRDR